MKYSWQELKNIIGDRAKDIIVSELQLKHLSANKYACKFNNPPHTKENAISEWNTSNYSFHCYDCKNNYDIINHAQETSDATEYLYNLAGIEYKRRPIQVIKPISKATGGAGYQYLYDRLITKDTLRKYMVTIDSKWIYFNYLNENKKLLKIKQRGIGEFKNGDKGKWSAPKGGTNILYGMHLFNRQRHLVLCEGEIDSLLFYELLKENKLENDILSCSIPSGAGSFGWIDECEMFLANFDKIIAVPDNDKSGQLNNIDFAEFYKNCKDDKQDIDMQKYLFKYMPKLNGVKQAHSVSMTEDKCGFRSGFLTFDYNDSGIKGNHFCLLTGLTNSGKSTYARQFLISAVKEKKQAFMFIGESSVEEEKQSLSQICATREDISSRKNIGGRVVYSVSKQAEIRFNQTYGQNIFITDADTLNKEAKIANISLFDKLLKEMEKMALSGVKMFLLDNLMILCSESGSKLNQEQKKIAIALKKFSKTFDVFVLLVAHPRGGEGQQRISGAQEIQNLADTILRYIRLNDENKAILLKNIKVSAEVKERCSALIVTEKIRKNGTKYICCLEWEETTGALYDLSSFEYASSYEREGYWTRHVYRYPSKLEPTMTPYKD